MLNSFRMERNQAKLEVFLEITKIFRERFDVVLGLHGSLGLWLEIGEYGESNDLDIIVPDYVLSSDFWPTAVETLETIGAWFLDGVGEKDFFMNGEHVSFFPMSSLNGIFFGNMKVSKIGEVCFLKMNLCQYHQLYSYFLNLDHRDYKKDSDMRKLEYIEEHYGEKKSNAVGF